MSIERRLRRVEEARHQPEPDPGAAERVQRYLGIFAEWEERGYLPDDETIKSFVLNHYDADRGECIADG